jgi:hypothetical protein
MPTRRMAAWLVPPILALVVAACSSSSASTAPSSAGGATSQPTTAPTSAAPSVESAAPSAAESATPSIAIPTFILPNDDKGLEALLPAKLCGTEALKLSVSGARFAATETPAQKAVLDQLGKTSADVAFAVSSPSPTADNCNTSAFVYRIKGADPEKFKALFIALAKQEEGTTYVTGNVGGKDVYIGTTPGNDTTTYAYFKGDALFGVDAPDDASAAPALQVMP